MLSRLRTPLLSLSGAAVCAAVAPLALPQMSSDQFDMLRIGFALVFLVISLSIHEVAHAWVADLCGDPTAKDLGRITLNPLAHIALFETILLPLMTLLVTQGQFAFGGAKPVPVSYHRLRHPLRDMMLVAIAGPLANVLLAVVFLVALKAAVSWGGYQEAELLPRVLRVSCATNLVLAAFNMMPIPPLDGSRVMAWLLPAAVRGAYLQLERFGFLLVMGAWYFVPGVNRAIYGGVNQLATLLDTLTGGEW